MALALAFQCSFQRSSHAAGISGGVGGTALNIFEHALYGAERLGRKGDNILEAEVEDEAQEQERMSRFSFSFLRRLRSRRGC